MPPIRTRDDMQRNELITLLRKYGFIETGEAIIFLSIIAEEELRSEDKQFVFTKIAQCLAHHEDGSPYFAQLRELKTGLEQSLHATAQNGDAINTGVYANKVS